MIVTSEKSIYEVLYAEDDTIAQKLLYDYVKTYNYPYNVTLASSFEEAVEKLKNFKYDVVLADYYLGDGEGINLIQYLRGAPLIIITGAGDEEIAINSMKSGAYDYLVKSPQLTHLKKLSFTIENAVSRKKMDDLIQMHSQAIQDITDAVFFIDTRNRFIYVNDAFCKMYQYDREEIIGKNLGTIWEKGGRVFEKFYDKKFSGDYYSIKSDGTVFPVSLTYTPIRQKDGEIIASVGIARDITEQKKTQLVLKKYSEHLEKLVEEKTKELREKERLATIGETATMVGHDLRNPLQVLINSIYIAKSSINEKTVGNQTIDEVAAIFNEMMEQVEYMNKIVSDLQYYGKNLKPDFKKVDLEAFLYKIISEHANFDNIEYQVIIEPKANEIYFDKDLMQRLFINLFSNSQAAMKDEGIIKIKAVKSRKNYIITVSDNGRGIPEEVMPNLFKPLFTTKAKGTGLGLSVCKRIIEAHKGKIEVESIEGRGTTVKLTIPELIEEK